VFARGARGKSIARERAWEGGRGKFIRALQRASFEFQLNAARYFGIKISARNIALVNMPAALSAVIYYSGRPVVELCGVYRVT